jgi:trk system potassium uptake protein TrkH
LQNPFAPRPGDKVVRRPRQSEMSPVRARVERREVPVRGPTSPMMLVYSFFAFAAIGALLLSLPVSNTAEEFMSPITTFFTSVSAMTGTGLVIVDTRDGWTSFGQVVIAGLIFIGGLGFMTGAAFLLLITGRRSSLQGRLVVGAGLDDNRLGTIATLARNIILMAIIVQIIGAIFIFVRWYLVAPIWEGMSLGEGLWQSVFTSISAFNNAGFDILPDDLVGGGSLIGLSRDIPTLLIIGAMILIGSSSYATLANVIEIRGWHRRALGSRRMWVGIGVLSVIGLGAFTTLIGVNRDEQSLRIFGLIILTLSASYASFAYVISIRRWRHLTLDTKLVLVGIGVMLLIGFVSFMSLEWSNAATIGNEPVRSKVTQGFFHTINRTAGFATVDYANLHKANMGVTEGLMFVGGASASTAGGIKVNTFMVIVIASIAIFSGKERTTVFGREIPRVNVQRAMAVGSTAAAAVLVLVVALFIVQPGLDFRTGVFEIISAFGTVGWSAGATSQLNEGAQIVLSLTMFAGRFGPLTIALFMAGRARQDSIRYATERIRIG